MNVDPSGIGFDLEVPLPVVIGTIPLRQIVEMYPPSPPPGYEHWQNPDPGMQMYPMNARMIT